MLTMPIRPDYLMSGMAAVMLLTAGCAMPPRSGEPVRQTVTTQDAAGRDALWTVSQNVLRRHGYKIDRLDRRAGVITTEPETSQHFFEFWRDDVDTPYDFAEATLRTVRRTVEVHLLPDDDPDTTDIRVVVRRQIFSTPDRQFNSSLAAFRMFGTQLPSEVTGEKITRQQDTWLHAGRDLAMEQYLLDQILSRWQPRSPFQSS